MLGRAAVMAAEPLVDVERLSAHYALRTGVFARPSAFVRAVDDVSFRISTGETLGLVGKSGCGKTTLGRTILGLRRATSGTVRIGGQPVFDLGAAALKRLRRDMQIVFQDPYAALDPRRSTGSAVRVPLDLHGIGVPAERRAMVAELFRQVGLEPAYMDRFPHELSGGQRQRVVIARAIATKPRLLVCDEPVSALDVSIQAQILNLLKDLQAQLGLTCLFISHNLAVVEHMADRVAVMYYGRIVEVAERVELYRNPQHPYTRALFASVPYPDPARRSLDAPVLGDPPDPAHLPSGCRFRTRCPLAAERCAREEPALAALASRHEVACWAASRIPPAEPATGCSCPASGG